MAAFQPPIRYGVKGQRFDDFVTDGEMLGKGATAFVFKGRNVHTGQLVAIKEIDFKRVGRSISKKEKQLMESEILIMRQLSVFCHENIVCLHKDLKMSSPSGHQYQYLVLDFCDQGELHHYLKKRRNILPEAEAKMFMTQFARALRFLRFHNISHRDLKPQNLLIKNEGENMRLKIADFGMAKIVETQDLAGTMCGSPLYMAPEIHARNSYSVKADLWSVGIILYQIIFGKGPFSATTLEELTWKLKTQPITFPPRMKISEELKNLISRLLVKQPISRISWEEFFVHPWFAEQITLPAHLEESETTEEDEEFMKKMEDCLEVGRLGDEIYHHYGTNGEALTMYLKALTDLKQLFRTHSDHCSSQFKQHFEMYLLKAGNIAKQNTEPAGDASKLIYAKFVGLCEQATQCEINGEYHEAEEVYKVAEKYILLLHKDANGPDKVEINKVLEALHIRKVTVHSQFDV